MCHECPTCEDSFDTRRGLGVHHVHAHDERLPNRECDNCSTDFYSEYERAYCSEECLAAAVSFEGSDNPNYSGAKEKTTCDICGTKFEYYPSNKEGLYCRECVEEEAWQEPPGISGPEHPRWAGGDVTLDCTVCGTTVEQEQRNITGEVVVCSKECQRTWFSETFTGEGHPNWKGGGNEPYGKGWSRIRTEALERDGHECVVCGKTRDRIGRNPDVHHIRPVREFIESENHAKEDTRARQRRLPLY